MKNTVVVSIILPVYNSKDTIKDTIESIEKQTYQNYQLVIINDGSNDNSDEIISKKVKDNHKITYINNTNHGVSYSRNIGIKQATGKYIIFIDSDDLYEANYIEEMLKQIEKNEQTLVVCGYTNFNKSERDVLLGNNYKMEGIHEIVELLQPSLLFNQLWNKIFITKIIQENNITFDTNISIAEDCKFVLEYLKYCNKAIYINKPLYKYRITQNGLGFKFRTDSNKIKIELIQKLEEMYEKNNIENRQYILKSYIKQYISFFAKITDKRYLIKKSEKLEQIKQILQSKEYKETIEKVTKSSNRKMKLLGELLKTENSRYIYIIGLLGNQYDKIKKKQILKVLK